MDHATLKETVCNFIENQRIAAYLTMQNPDGGFKDMLRGIFEIAPLFVTPEGTSGSTGTWMYTAAIGLAATVLDESPLKGDWQFNPKIGHLVCAPAFRSMNLRRQS